MDFVIEVVGQVGTNGQVVHVNDKPAFPDVVSKVKVHKCLKRRWRAAKSKEHHRWFEQSKRGDERHLPFVTLLDSNVIIPPLHVKLGEEGELAEIVDEVGDKG